MKIGFSFGRCVRDIVTGVVNIDDVLVIVGRTCMPSRTDCEWVIDQYLASHYLRGLDREQCMQVGLALYDSCRIIEPRGQGGYVTQVPRDCVWMDLFPTIISDNSSVKAAWEHYRMLIGLTAQLPEVDEEVLRARVSVAVPAEVVGAKKKRKTKAEKEKDALLNLLALHMV